MSNPQSEPAATAPLTGIEETASMWISRWHAGLSPAKEAEFHQWLRSDERHAAAMYKFRNTWLPAHYEGPADDARATVEWFIQRDARRRKRRNVRTALTLAVMAVAIALMYYRNPRMEAPVAPAPSTIAPARVERLDMRDLPISEAIRILNAQNSVKLTLGDASVGTLKVSGSVSAGNPEAFVRLLASVLGVTSERRADEIVLRAPSSARP